MHTPFLDLRFFRFFLISNESRTNHSHLQTTTKGAFSIKGASHFFKASKADKDQQWYAAPARLTHALLVYRRRWYSIDCVHGLQADKDQAMVQDGSEDLTVFVQNLLEQMVQRTLKHHRTKTTTPQHHQT